MLMKTTVTSSPSLAGTSGITLTRCAFHTTATWSLKPLSLTIEPGEVLALIGPFRFRENHGVVGDCRFCATGWRSDPDRRY